MNHTTLLSLTLLCFVALGAPAEEPGAAPPTTRPHPLTLSPSPMPAPAMKYRLMPDALDLQPGNAATLYLVATSRNLIGNLEPWVDEAPIDEWLTMPIDKLPRAEAEKYVQRFHNPLHQVELGARRETCHWDMPYRQDGFGTLLPYLSDLRMLARVIALKARLQIADGKYAEAAYTLQTGFGLARHLDRWEAFLIQMLVAANVQNMMLEQVEFWVSRPGSPNLTWSLVNLPQPMLNVRGGLEYERAGIGYAIPELKSAAAGKLTAEELRRMLVNTHVEDPHAADVDAIAESIRIATRDTVGAKTYLLNEAGYKAAELDAMQPPAILGLYYASSFERWHDEAIKWYGLPFPQAATGIAQTIKDFDQFGKSHVENPMLRVLSAYQKILLSAVNNDRRVDELRCLEAIRAYASAHGGKLPSSLRDVTEAPIPTDPVTGGEFPYSSQGTTARLDAPLPAGGSPKDGRTYELRAGK
jgi:hypothetical protein